MAPTLLTATVVPPDIDLAWTDNSDNETGFTIWRSDDGTNFTQIDTVPANTEIYTDTTAIAGQDYWYRVQAYNDDNTSDYSNTVSTKIEFAEINYGLLYNMYAFTDARNLANSGWHVPTEAEINTLITYLGGGDTAGDKMRETGTEHWTTEAGATNESGLTLRGSGERNTDGTFDGLQQYYIFISTTAGVPNTTRGFVVSTSGIINTNFYYKEGHPIRLLKDSTSKSEGETGTYIGNDGKVYPTIAIGAIGSEQEWMAMPLAETKYRNGDLIPEVTNNATWAGLATGAWCYYNNDPSNM